LLLQVPHLMLQSHPSNTKPSNIEEAHEAAIQRKFTSHL
jgi:hypothetical protein